MLPCPGTIWENRVNQSAPYVDPHVTATLVSELAQLSDADLLALTRRYEWLTDARRAQLPPPEFDDLLAWLIRAGRGAGKTRAGAEWVWWESYVSEYRVAVVGPTSPDVRKTCFEGESGLMSRIPPELVVNYNRSSLELWMRTRSGGESYIVGYSAEEPDRLRGPQHHIFWADELGAWGKPKTQVGATDSLDAETKAEATWDNLLFGLRLGSRPRGVITTTPRVTNLVRKLMRDPSVVQTFMTTYENTALPEAILRVYREKYEGTRLGRQELYAELVDDVVGALWTSEILARCYWHPDTQPLRRVVAVDPSGSRHDSVGLIVAEEHPPGPGEEWPRYHVLCDRTAGGSPEQWGRRVVDTYDEFGADVVVGETNYGGDMVESTIRSVDPSVNFRKVTASRGKVVRAEPIAALYEQGRVTHEKGMTKLEEQMCQFSYSGYQGEGSPDRVDALVWAISHLAKTKRREMPALAVEGGSKVGVNLSRADEE